MRAGETGRRCRKDSEESRPTGDDCMYGGDAYKGEIEPGMAYTCDHLFSSLCQICGVILTIGE